MTTGARHIARRMRTRCPVVRGVRLMAGQALCVLPGCGCQRFGTEVDHSGQRSASRPHVRAARPVTRLALQPTVPEWPARIVRLRVLGMENTRDGRITMATQTGIRSLRTVGRIGCYRDCRWWRIGRERRRTCAQQQSKCGSHAGSLKPPHSIRRGRDVVHDSHVRHSAGPVTDAAGLHVSRVGAENSPPFGVLRDRGRSAVLLHVGLADGIHVA
jgi:hypothetical protein